MRVFLIRHGESKDNLHKIISGHRAVSLTSLGKKQAKNLGKKLRNRKILFDAVYSSDLQRAAETTVIICKMLQIKNCFFDKRLRERDAGIFTGRCSQSLTPEEVAFREMTLNDLDKKIPEGESNREMLERVQEVFFEIIAQHKENETILIVAHGGTLYHILVRILKVLPEQLDEWFGNCEPTVIEREKRSAPWKVTYFNDKKLL